MADKTHYEKRDLILKTIPQDKRSYLIQISEDYTNSPEASLILLQKIVEQYSSGYEEGYHDAFA